jgi:hypothetical protein
VPRTLRANVTERHIPGGPRSYIDLGGRSFPHVTLTLKFAHLQQAKTFEARYLGVRDHLVTFEGTCDATLVSINRQPWGVGAGGRDLGGGALSLGGASLLTCDFIVHEVLKFPAAGPLSVPTLGTFEMSGALYRLFTLDPITRSAASIVTARHLPSFDADWLDDQGISLPRLSTSLVFADTLHLLQFETVCGLQGTLTLREGTYAAIPLSVNRTAQSANARGECTASVEWLILTPDAIVRTPWWRVRVLAPEQNLQQYLSDPQAQWTELQDVFACQAVYGYDTRVSECTLTVPRVPDGVGYTSPIDISFGADPELPSDPTTHYATQPSRFVGYVVEFDSTLAPNAVGIVCRGELWKAQITANRTGMPVDLTEHGAGQTEQQMIAKLIQYADVWMATDDIGHIDTGTPNYHGTGPPKLGTINSLQYVWAANQTILDVLDQLDEICLGYRTFDTVGGNVVRRRVSMAYPDIAHWLGAVYDVASGQYVGGVTYAEGRNIISGTNYGSILQQYSAAAVSTTKQSTTQNDGMWFGALATQDDAAPHTNVEELSSMLIERQWSTSSSNCTPLPHTHHNADPGDGLTCEDVAGWRIAEISPILSKLEFVTGDDDHGKVQPGSVIVVDAPVRLGISQLCWVQSVKPSFDESGAFSLQITCWTATTATGGAGVRQ